MADGLDALLTCGVIGLPVAGVIAWWVVAQGRVRQRAQQELQEAQAKYRQALDALKARPADAHAREGALQWGRRYSALTRQSGGTTVFDEVALSNDLNAAAAGAAAPAVQAQPLAASLEDRLERLRVLAEKGTITDEEHRTRRADLLREV